MAHVTEEYIHRLYQCYGELKVLDDIIRNRAADSPPRPILAYPRCENSIDDYEYFTGKQLDLFVDASAKQFISLGVKPVRSIPSSIFDWLSSSLPCYC